MTDADRKPPSATTTAANASTFSTGTLAGGSWYFRVAAFNALGDSDSSNVLTMTL